MEDRPRAAASAPGCCATWPATPTTRGYRRLVCLAEPDNDAVLPTVRRAGLEGVPEQVDGVVEVVVPLPARRRGLRRPA